MCLWFKELLRDFSLKHFCLLLSFVSSVVSFLALLVGPFLAKFPVLFIVGKLSLVCCPLGWLRKPDEQDYVLDQQQL